MAPSRCSSNGKMTSRGPIPAVPWIAAAVKKPGQLHTDLGVPQGKTIPKGKIVAAAKKPGKVGQRARFAMNVGKIATAAKKPGKVGQSAWFVKNILKK